MPDILLIQPPIRDFYLTAKRTIPYGLACIAATLLRDGFSVQILDALATRKTKKIALPPEMSYLGAFYPGPDISPFSLFHEFRHYGLDFDRIGEIARDSGAFLIGISSLFTAYSDEALATVRAVKKHCPRAAVVLGGHHPTEMPEDVLRNECVDFVIRGEGEEALPRLARILGASISQEGASPQGADPFANVHKKPPGITAPGLTSPCRAGSPADPGEMPPDMSAPGGHKVCGIAGFPAGIFESVPGLGFRRSDGSLFLNDPPILARTPAKIPNQRLSFDSPV
ncbi:MAG: cobalamin-dependent protein, partial [Syntrophobacteraceae bacterium]